MENIILNIDNIQYIKNEIIEKKIKLYNQYIHLDVNNFELIEKLRWYFMFVNHRYVHDIDYNLEDNTLIYSRSLYSHDEIIYKINKDVVKKDLGNIHCYIKNIVVNTNFLENIEEYYDEIKENIENIIVVSSYNTVIINIKDKDYKKFRNSYEYEICTKFFRSRFMSK